MTDIASLGVGIIGCGNISETYLRLAPLFRTFEIRAVADLNMAAAEARAVQFGVEARSVEALLASEDIQIVVNLTVPQAHFDVTRRILECGKHAYSEKPFVLTLEEGEALRQLAANTGLRIGSAPDTFLGGAHQLARAVIDEGRVGKILSGTCHVMGPGMESWHPNPDFFFQPGGGPVLDMGPYYLTNLVQLLGPVRAVTAMGSAGFKTRAIGSGDRTGETIPVDTPTNLHAVLEFASGALITLGASWDVQAHHHDVMELYGSKGSIFLPDPNFFGGAVQLAEAGGEESTLDDRRHPLSTPNWPDGNGAAQANYRGVGLADMAAAILDGRAHRCGLELAGHVVDILGGILTSAETRSWVDMTTSCTRPAPLMPEDATALMN